MHYANEKIQAQQGSCSISCAALMGDTDNWGGCVHVKGAYGKSLYLLLIFAMILKLL
jgi:hypothetical protein